MTSKLVIIINSLKVPKLKKILLYEMKFLVPNYSCLQNPWLGGYRPQIPVLSVLCSQLNLLNPTEQNSWVRHWSAERLKIVQRLGRRNDNSVSMLGSLMSQLHNDKVNNYNNNNNNNNNCIYIILLSLKFIYIPHKTPFLPHSKRISSLLQRPTD